MENILNQGFGLALFGMITVFSFLTLLIIATRLMSFLVSRLDKEQELPLANTEPPQENHPPITAIMAAIAHYLSRKQP